MRAWAQLGAVLLVSHDLGSACDALRRSLSLVPEDCSTRHHLATALLARGQRAAAEQELGRILAFDSAHPGALVDLAVLALARRDAAGALTLLERVRPADDSGRVRFYRAMALRGLDRGADATTLLEQLAGEGAGKYGRLAAKELAQAYGPSDRQR